ncbi:MAG: beta-lactamase family protein [Acidobacteriota bacterium]|nr:beta-lactamase family protein [Acidobacteriota bacterium]
MPLDELRETNTPGAAVAVVSGDHLVYVKGLGLSNVETGTPVEPEMLFRTGSVGKMFTAALLTSLAEEGKIKLDEPFIFSCIPTFTTWRASPLHL